MANKEDCIFCKIAMKEIKTEKVAETQNFYAFPDAHPVSKGHTLIISKKHFINLLDLPANLGNELLDIIKKVVKIRLKQGAEGFNIVMNNNSVAGQVVMHAHIHIITRKQGDKVKLNQT